MYALIDIDGVIADLMTIWLNIYNIEWHDNLTYDQIIDWNTSQFVKPECGNKVYEIIERPEIYDYILPIPLASEGLDALRGIGFEIVYTTTATNGTAGVKYRWLNKYKLWKEQDHYIETKSKFLIKGDLLIDDGFHNIEKFDGYGLLYSQPWNLKFPYKNRINGWKDILDDINSYNSQLKII